MISGQSAAATLRCLEARSASEGIRVALQRGPSALPGWRHGLHSTRAAFTSGREARSASEGKRESCGCGPSALPGWRHGLLSTRAALTSCPEARSASEGRRVAGIGYRAQLPGWRWLASPPGSRRGLVERLVQSWPHRPTPKAPRGSEGMTLAITKRVVGPALRHRRGHIRRGTHAMLAIRQPTQGSRELLDGPHAHDIQKILETARLCGVVQGREHVAPRGPPLVTPRPTDISFVHELRAVARRMEGLAGPGTAGAARAERAVARRVPRHGRQS
jgi:hypothetical protein